MMTISMYHASVPVLVRALGNLQNLLAKGADHAKAKETDEANYLALRIAPDMLTLARQVQIACDIAKVCGARLAGAEPPKHDDDEASFADLIARCQKMIDYLGGFTAAQIDGSESKEITLAMRSGDLNYTGLDFLFNFGIANVHFHSTVTYALLRGAGVDIGKWDYLGKA